MVNSAPTVAGALVKSVQVTSEARFVVDCRVNPELLVGHAKTTFVPKRVIVSCGGGGSERLNTMPLPALPPCVVVPYSVLPDKINPAYGATPPLPPAKLHKFV